MRWVAFMLVSYLVVLLQTTVVGLIEIRGFGLAAVRPDLPAIVAAFVATRARNGLDAMLAALVLGIGLDLTLVGGKAVGLMPITYVLGAAAVFHVREALYRERLITQALLAAVFAGLAHGVWATLQGVLAGSAVTWGGYRTMMIQAAGIAVYTAVLAPLVNAGLHRTERLILIPATGRPGS